MRTSGRPRSAERLAAFALLACGVLAVLNLPRAEMPIGWLLAWTAPAALFGLLRQRTHHPWLRAVAAASVQVAAFAIAMRYTGPLSRPAILACTILPPLAFVTIRRRDADASLGLFLSFCVLLVGVILGGSDVALLAAYGTSACLSLRAESHLAALAVSRRNRWHNQRHRVARPVLLTAFAIALPCLFAAFAIDRTLAWVPSPLRADSADNRQGSGPSPMRSQGLDDSFDLGGGGVLANLSGEELVLARLDDGRPMPSNLYLRSGFFSVAHLDRWSNTRLALSDASQYRHHVLRRQTSRVPVKGLEIERFAGARNFIFVPPTALELHEVPGLQIDRARMWLRQKPGAEQTDYAVFYQELPPPDARAKADDRGLNAELLALPRGFGSDDRRRYQQLLDDWGATGTTMQIASRIAAGLAQRCTYDRVEPTGPFPHAVDNFLFAQGDRRGYCMHFASAAALLLRLAGVPCRIGVGLYGGDLDRVEPLARIYGSQHAHAWVEIPIVGRGFTVFDPTPPAERGQRMPSQLDSTADDEGDAVAARAADLWSGLIEFLTQPWVLVLILLAASVVTMWPGGKGAPEPQIVLPRSAQTARRLLGRILRALAEAGHLRNRGQTLEQFRTVLATRERLEPDVAAAFRAYQEVRFGGREYDEQRERMLLQGLEAARRIEVWPPPADSEPTG